AWRTPLSAVATGNLLRHSLTENCSSVGRSSADIPTTAAPNFLNWAAASLNAWASAVHPLVKAFGKKYRTSGPCFSCSARCSLNGLPATAPVVVKSGALEPTASSAEAGEAASPAAARAHRNMRIGVISLRRMTNGYVARLACGVQKRESLLVRIVVEQGCQRAFEDRAGLDLVEQRQRGPQLHRVDWSQDLVRSPLASPRK